MINTFMRKFKLPEQMDRKRSFTKTEVKQIKKLIAEKLRATPEKQKGIRAKIRKIGFHFSDFSSKKDGYTIADFEALIRSGAIKVIGDNVRPIFSTTTPKSFGRRTLRKTHKNISLKHS